MLWPHFLFGLMSSIFTVYEIVCEWDFYGKFLYEDLWDELEVVDTWLQLQHIADVNSPSYVWLA